jgi:hypothetical protein
VEHHRQRGQSLPHAQTRSTQPNAIPGSSIRPSVDQGLVKRSSLLELGFMVIP